MRSRCRQTRCGRGPGGGAAAGGGGWRRTGSWGSSTEVRTDMHQTGDMQWPDAEESCGARSRSGCRRPAEGRRRPETASTRGDAGSGLGHAGRVGRSRSAL